MPLFGNLFGGSKFMCPYCFQEYNKNEVLYVCPDCRSITIPSMREHGSVSVKCKAVLNGRACGGIATLRVCPRCGVDANGFPLFAQGDNTGIIPNQALDTPNLPFSIVGVSGSGKTNYITVMLNELGRAPGMRIALAPQNAYTRDTQKLNRDSIFEFHTVPAATRPGEIPPPQIWQIKNLTKKHGDVVPTYTFTIYDGAGEDHENIDLSSNVCRYINASRAIILTLDPLILSSLRRPGAIDAKVFANSGGGSQGSAVDVVNSIANYIKAARGLKAGKMLDIPVAVVLTKFDTILSSPGFSADALVKKPSLTISNGRVNLTEIQQVDTEIRNWLEMMGESAFIDAVESNFSEFFFFGVSSYGNPPKSQGVLADTIQPHRVLDPLMWFFKREGFVD